MTQTVRGYDIRLQRSGSEWMNEKAHAWSPAGTLPTEWEAVKADPTVEKAVIFLSTQRTRRADKRQIIDAFTRTIAS